MAIVILSIIFGTLGFIVGSFTGSGYIGPLLGGIGLMCPWIFLIIEMEKNIAYLKNKNDLLVDKVDDLMELIKEINSKI